MKVDRSKSMTYYEEMKNKNIVPNRQKYHMWIRMACETNNMDLLNIFYSDMEVFSFLIFIKGKKI
jgi:hypothetical protein